MHPAFSKMYLQTVLAYLVETIGSNKGKLPSKILLCFWFCRTFFIDFLFHFMSNIESP